METVVLHRVAFLEYFCPKQGQDFKPLTPIPKHGSSTPPGQHIALVQFDLSSYKKNNNNNKIVSLTKNLKLCLHTT